MHNKLKSVLQLNCLVLISSPPFPPFQVPHLLLMSLTALNTILTPSIIARILIHYMYLEIRLVESVWTQVSLPNKSELAITSHSVTWNHIFSGATSRTIAARPGTGTAITLVNLQNTHISHRKGGSITRILLVFI